MPSKDEGTRLCQESLGKEISTPLRLAICFACSKTFPHSTCLNETISELLGSLKPSLKLMINRHESFGVFLIVIYGCYFSSGFAVSHLNVNNFMNLGPI